MKKRACTFKTLFLTVALFVIFSGVNAQVRYAVSDGNWNSTSTWATSSGGPPGASVPSAATSVYIMGGIDVTVTADAACISVTFPGNNATLTVSTGTTLTVSGAVTLDNQLYSNTVCQIGGGGSLSCSTVNVGSGNDPGTNNTTYTHIFNSSIGELGISGSLNINSYIGNRTTRRGNGSFYLREGRVSVGATLVTSNENGVNTSTFSTDQSPASGTLVLNGASPFSISGTGTSNIIANGSNATVIYARSGAQNVQPLSYTNLIIDGGNTKTILNDIRVNGILSLANGNLSLGSGSDNVTLSSGASVTTPASFDNGHMIICDGSGYLVKEGNSESDFIITFPLGTGSFYTPFAITDFTASVSPAASVAIRAVASTAPGPPSAAGTDLAKYWNVTTSSLNNINASVEMTYAAPWETGPGGDQSNYIPYLYTSGAWIMPGTGSPAGINPMTVTGTSVLQGQWTAREKPVITTYYSYKSGSWNSSDTWTTDPSGTLSVGSSVPDETDRVVILNGRTVTATTNGESVLSVQINEGGTIDLGNFTSHDFTVLRGKGLLRLSTSLFPSGDLTGFVSAGGGTVEYYNSSGFTFSQLTYNNLIINHSSSSVAATLTGNMTINGDLTIRTGQFRINDGSPVSRIASVAGDVLVNNAGSIGLGTGNANHRFIVNGDFTNLGTVRLTNQPAPSYTTTPTNGRADLVFNNALADQSLLCQGQTDIYRLEIDKGIDKTFVLNIDADNSSNFVLFGRNNLQSSPPLNDPPEIENPNALGLLAGTVRIGPDIIIPCLSNAVYNIDLDARLWIDGGNVTFTNGTSTSSIVVYGSLRVSNMGTLIANGEQGIVMRDQSELLIESGEVTTDCIRTSYISGTHRGAFIMTGGTLNIAGNSYNIAGLNIYASFTLPYPDNVFRMSGGTININSPTTITGGAGSNFSMILGSNLNNSSVTGGTINITIPGSRNAYINTTVPLWNLNFISASATYRGQIQAYAGNSSPPIPAIPAKPLIVKNDLNVINRAIFNANGNDVTVSGNFSVDAGSEYETGNNTTTFNGKNGQRFTNAGIMNNGTGIYNLVIADSSNTEVYSDNLILRGSLTIGTSSILNDIGHSLSVAGDIFNSGTHVSQAGGSIILNGSSNQILGGSGSGKFANLTVNKVSGTTTFQSGQSVTGNLRLASGILDIVTFNLTLGPNSSIYDALSGTSSAFSATKMIRLAGNHSDPGITRVFDSPLTFLFPVGTETDYTPVTTVLSAAPSQWGSVTVRPVNKIHPFATSPSALSYYWVVTSSGFSGIPAGSVSHTFRYPTSDINGTESAYIPSVYRPYSWAPFNDNSRVVDASNTILFPAESIIDGNYTAGELPAFSNVKVYYSRQDGPWDDPNTWSSTATGGPSDGSLPGSASPVVIGDGTINHSVTVPEGLNNIATGSIRIHQGSVLDISTTTGHNFGIYVNPESGSGTLRISSSSATAIFPGGDFGAFLAHGGGDVEYYSSATTGISSFTLPLSYLSAGSAVPLVNYNNLILSPGESKDITLPDVSINVSGELRISGPGLSKLNTSASTRTVTVSSGLEISGGTLRFMNALNTPQDMLVLGDVTVGPEATFDVSNTGVASNTMTIHGNLINDGIFNMRTGASQVCNVTFAGGVDRQIAGSGSVTSFNIIEVNKGSSRNTLLEVVSDVLSLNTDLPTALTLTNGTFRLTSPLTLNLTNSGSFTIPVSGSLSANGGTINIGGPAATNSTDLILDGRLEIMAGAVNIGTSGTSFNNDIVYSSGGIPEIIISGGSLFVNGQIRRGTTINTGSLNYIQSNQLSTVIIAGENANPDRGIFEILNTGSKFSMSGGTLGITGSFNVPSTIDFYLVPDTSEVTGGTVRFGSSVTPASTTFSMVTSVPLFNLEVEAEVNTKILDLKVYPLILGNDLVVNGNSSFRANGLDVTIGRSLVNMNSSAASGLSAGGYQPGLITQTTFFNGMGAGSIRGEGSNLTNFANLSVSTADTLSLASNTTLRVGGDMSLLGGVLYDGGNMIYLNGDLTDESEHYSPLADGGISFEGTRPQYISVSLGGELGNIIINNTTGVSVTDNLTINGMLTFSQGLLYIDDYLLTLGVNSSVGGTTDNTRMIVLNGVISDSGVRRFFPSGASTFTFPIGVAGKYTPVSYSFISNPNTGASVTVEPVNNAHPVMALPQGDELEYYWNIRSEGFSQPFTVDHHYYYIPEDVSGDESSYYAGRFHNREWIPEGGIDGTAVDPAGHSINLPSGDFIDGEYTAGYSANFTNKFTLYSIKSGNWFGDNTWSVSEGGPPCGFDPYGHPVVISTGHIVTLNSNSATAYSVTLNGTLDVGLTTFHSLGHVNGGGTLKLTSTPEGLFVFPGGDFYDFVNTSGSTVHFFGDNEAVLPAKPGNIYKPYQNVILSGTGRKLLSAEEFKALGNVTIEGPNTVLSNEIYGKRVFIGGNWTDNNTSASGGFLPGKGKVIFDGTSLQVMNITGGPVTEKFYDLEISNSAGLTLSGTGKIEVSHKLILDNGIISTNDTNILYLSGTGSLIEGGDELSFVSGPLRKWLAAGSGFTFPTGDLTGVRFGQVSLEDVSLAGDYTAQYFNHNPLAEGYDPLETTSPVDVVSDNEYWTITGPASSAGTVILRWDDLSGIIPADAVTRGKLRVVEWETSWVNRGNSGLSGDQLAGTIESSPAVGLTGTNHFTLGAESLPTATITSSDAAICDDGSAVTINIELTGTAPWTLKYLINGSNETTVSNIATSPYPLVVSNALPALDAGGPGNYAFSVSYVSDATGSTGIRDFTSAVVITLNPTPAPVISGLTTTPAGSLVTYSAPQADGILYQWTVTGGTIQSGQGTYSIEVLWGPGPAGSVVLEETAVTGGCSAVTDHYNVSLTDIPDPQISGSDNACLNTVAIYSTPLVSGHTYSWSVAGGSFVTGPDGNSITVTWNLTGDMTVSVTETGSVAITESLPVTVNPVPPSDNTVSDPAACLNSQAHIIIFGAPAGITYQLRLNSDNSPVGLPVSSMGGGDVTITIAALSSEVYNIWASNEYGCGVMLSDLANVTVTSDQTWTGSIDTDWNNPANWSCGSVPNLTHNVTVPDVVVKPQLVSGLAGEANNLVIEPGASLLLAGNTLRIAGSVTSDGTLDASAGTLELCGSLLQQIAANTFTGNNVMNMIVSNSTGVSLLGELIVTGMVTVNSGALNSDGFLTLASSAASTAVINGQGTGEVNGTVTMQRYLPSGFGYRYISSPFTNSTVSELADDINLASSFPSIYRFDEDRTSSGWVSYTAAANILYPMAGYTVNTGSASAAKTIDISGVVNNGPLSVTLYNHNRTYTDGFNLIGNPYPSPIDWDSEEGWNRTNIDDAIYFFRASSGDQYGGTYSSYVNGISSDGNASSVISSMQGFFVKVSAGSYPVTGTISIDNRARVNSLTPLYMKSENKGPVALIRLGARSGDNALTSDVLAVYLDPKATEGYDGELDALKILNTDMQVLNLWTVEPGQKRLSINALPDQPDEDYEIPVGIKTSRSGNVIFSLTHEEGLMAREGIYLTDALTGTVTRLGGGQSYSIDLGTGDHSGRFFLNIKNLTTGIDDPVMHDSWFNAYSSGGHVMGEVINLNGGRGSLEIINLFGQTVYREEIYEPGTIDIDPGLNEGIYIISFSTGNVRKTLKLYITSR